MPALYTYQEVFLKLNGNPGAAAGKEESNRDIERKYIRPRIRSYSYISPLARAIFGQLTNDSYSIHSYIYGICTHHFFVKMMNHSFANKPKLYLDRILI